MYSQSQYNTTLVSIPLSMSRAVKNQYGDLLLLLDKLAKKKGKERDEAACLRLKMNTFEFVIMLLIWEKVLTAIQMNCFS